MPSVLSNPQDAEFWILIALVVFVVILWRARAPAMAVKALDAAGAKVQSQLDEAKRLREEAEALLAQIHIQRAETEHSAAELLRAAQDDAERLRAEAAVKLEEDVRRRGLLAERKIAQAEAQAAAEVKAAAAELASHAAETILAARIARATSDPLIDESLDGLGRRFS
jgi:F-type H+-transporting ATPase subunit b